MKQPLSELKQFNEAMNAILKAKPEMVKRVMELEKQERPNRRKPRQTSARVSSSKA